MLYGFVLYVFGDLKDSYQGIAHTHGGAQLKPTTILYMHVPQDRYLAARGKGTILSIYLCA